MYAAAPLLAIAIGSSLSGRDPVALLSEGMYGAERMPGEKARAASLTAAATTPDQIRRAAIVSQQVAAKDASIRDQLSYLDSAGALQPLLYAQRNTTFGKSLVTGGYSSGAGQLTFTPTDFTQGTKPPGLNLLGVLQSLFSNANANGPSLAALTMAPAAAETGKAAGATGSNPAAGGISGPLLVAGLALAAAFFFTQ